MVKSQVSEGTVLAYRVRAAFEVYFKDHGELPTSNEEADLPTSSEVNGKYVSQISIESGQIIVVYGKAADERVVGKRVVFVPDASNGQDVSWACSSPDIPNKWLTSECQSN